ncbi:hypothetical protein [Paenibacillus elgii]|uniref:hypothetical protein n=1 Tax=Paenibacillus elgii TaxID=189691 RepID=UPI00203C5F53|nr:hypothetical protein [Paenibacillus elgii]MCM3273910.1 hypothetical protein [Paenibacillus elgii]
MKGCIIELSQKKSFSGRRYIKWIVHEIYKTSTEYNKNGISWKEEYVKNNLESAKGMPICVEFLDWNKSEPYGHGMTGVEDNEPVFENSVTVGFTENAFIDDIEVNGKKIRALIAEGYVFEQRYPRFTDWLKTKIFDGNIPETSVEICKKKDSENQVIIYEDGWKEKGRVPMVYDYSGSAILGIAPSDDNAVLLELNNKKERGSEMKETKDVIELSQRLEKTVDENEKLKNAVKEKETKIAELNSQVTALTKEFEVKASDYLNLKEESLKKDEQIQSLTVELNELKQFQKQELNKAMINELNSKLQDFDKAEIQFVQSKIDDFLKEPAREKLDSIVIEINSEIAKKVIEAKKAAKENKTNDDIYSSMYEYNSEDITDEELY